MRKTVVTALLLGAFAALAFGQGASAPGDAPTAGDAGAATPGRIRLPSYFYKRFEGTIGGTLHVVMNLMRVGDRVAGDYYYERIGEPITFAYSSSISNDGELYLAESTGPLYANSGSNASGAFRGRFTSEHEIAGTWSNGDATYPFALTERYPAGSIRLDVVRVAASAGASRGSARIEFVYPLPAGADALDAAAAQQLALEIRTAITSAYATNRPELPRAGVSAIFDDFVERFESLVNDPHFTGPDFEQWDDSFVTSVMQNDGGVLALQNEAFTYEGGAHPLTLYSYGNYALPSAAPIALADLVVPGSSVRLDSLGEAALRRDYRVPDGETLTDAGFFLNGPFALNDNFLVTRGGLLFRFNQYEIGPYVLGSPEVFIPYADITGLLKHGSAIAELVR